MGNFEKLSVLVIVVIIVMILVVALYTWTDKPADEGTTADDGGTPVVDVGLNNTAGYGDPKADKSEVPISQPGGDTIGDPNGETPKGDIGIPIDQDPEMDPRVGADPIVVKVEEEPGANEPWSYTFKRGEVVSKVCNRELGAYYKYLPQLKTLNPGLDFDRISEGQTITMPPRGMKSDSDASSGTLAKGTEPQPQGSAVPGGEWIVKRGESLKDIAKLVYGDWTVWPRIYAKNLNKIKNPQYPTPGTRLTLPKR